MNGVHREEGAEAEVEEAAAAAVVVEGVGAVERTKANQ